MIKTLLFMLLSVVITFSQVSAAPAAKYPVNSERWTDDYDGYFQKYTKRYFGPNFNWKWFKAQAIAESALKEGLTSVAGAQGLMQILPTTFQEIQQINPYFSNIDSPEWNIAAGIYYDRWLYRKWRVKLPERERLFLTFASYNAGLGRILKAYKRAEKPVVSWDQIQPHVPKETKGYVKRINALMEGEGKRSKRLRGFAELFGKEVTL